MLAAAHILLGFGGASTAAAQTALELEPGGFYRKLAPWASALRDPAGDLDVAEVAAAPQRFQPVGASRIDFGFTDDTIWLRLPLRNVGNRAGEWLLALNTRFMHSLRAYLLRGPAMEPLIRNDASSSFSARPVPYRHLLTPFSLAPGETGVLLIGYASAGATALPLSIETELSFIERRADEDRKNTIFYTAALLMIVFSLLFATVNRWQVHVAYAAYFAWVTFYIAHMDGYTFQFLWPDLPQWNALAAQPVGLAINFFAAVFARAFLMSRRRHPRIDRVLRGVIWSTVALILLTPWADVLHLKKYAFIYTLLCSFVFLGCALAAMRGGQPGLRSFVAGWVAIAGSAILTNWAHWLASPVAVSASFDVIRVGILLEATMLALAILEQLQQVRRERDAALRREVRLAEEKLAAERAERQALALADRRGIQLAAASHDLKQPLTSLRMLVHAALGADKAPAAATIRQTLHYLDDLVRRYLEDPAQPAAAEVPAASAPADAVDSLQETLPADVLLRNVVRMFEAEAASQGKQLRMVSCRALISASPIALMRVVSNLVANALRHGGGKCLVGCRRAGDRLRIEVHDSGGGLPPDRLRTLLEATGEAPAAGESGLGLRIVASIAAEQGYRLHARGGDRVGTVVAVEVPLAIDPVIQGARLELGRSPIAAD